MPERKIVEDAKKIEELMWQLEVNADQERMDELKPREIEEYPDEEILSEAEYVLSTYYETGFGSHHHGIVWSGKDVTRAKRQASEAVFRGPNEVKKAAAALKYEIEKQKEAKAEVRRLKRLIKNHSQ